MATPQLVTVRDFTNSRYAQLAESSDSLNMSDVLASAEVVIQTKLGRQILSSPYTIIVRNTDVNTFFVPNRPLQAVTQVRKRMPTPYGVWEVVDPAYYYYETGPGYVQMNNTSVRGYDVEVTYTAGYDELPLDLKEAILLQAVLLSTQDFEVYGTGDSRAPGYVEYINRDIDMWLAPYRATASVYR